MHDATGSPNSSNRRTVDNGEPPALRKGQDLEQPERHIACDSMPHQREPRQLIQLLDNAQEVYSEGNLIHELFEGQAERVPDQVAAICGGRELTYAELNVRANRVARYLRKMGVGADQLVGICVERSLEMLVGMVGILKSGCAYVPLDPGYPPDRLAFMLSDAAPKVLLTQGNLREKLEGTAAEIVCLDHQWADMAAEDSNNLEWETPALDPNHLAYVIYTSGSTGTPKGVMVEHRSLNNLVAWHVRTFDLKIGTRGSCIAGLGFDASTWEIWPSLCSGGCLLLPPPATSSDPQNLLKWWQRQDLDVSFLVTPLAELAYATGFINARVRIILTGGDRLRRWPEALPGQQQLVNNYGPTETTIIATSGRLYKDDSVLHIGRPIANTWVYVLDANMQPVAVGVGGELYIGGYGVARGYLNQPELTSERFLPDPFSSDRQGRMYKTGDLGRQRSDGTIEFLGRADHQVKIRGFRVELGEIEAQLLRHPHVKEAVVVARGSSAGEKRLLAYVTCKDPHSRDAAPSVEALRGHLKVLLPEYMVPAAFVVLDSLPLTQNGKLDRNNLPEPDSRSYTSRQFEPPQGETEEILSKLWEKLLRVTEVGRHDTFFELGGHSLLVVELMDQLLRLGLYADVQTLYSNPTLATLASTLSHKSAQITEIPPNLISPDCRVISPSMLTLIELTAAHIERIVDSVPGGAGNVQDIYPLAPLQEGILFHHLLYPEGGDTYVLPILFSLESEDKLENFVAALNAVIARHDILRTAVLWEQLPQPMQVVHRQVSLSVEEIELRQEFDPLQQLKERMNPEHQRLDPRKAPMMRLQFAKSGPGTQRYALLQMHHLLCDHVSMDTMLEEIADHIEGRADKLPAPYAYRNHVAQALAHARKNNSEAFFRIKLGDVDESTAPFGLLNVHGNGSRKLRARRALEPELAEQIRLRARRLSVTAATLFHVAWALVVAHTSGRDDVVFGTLLLGRLQGSAGAQRILGLFINTLPLRMRLRDVTIKELVERTHQELVELLGHEQASLAVAQRCSGMAGLEPLFTTLLNYRHSVTNPETEQHTIAPGVDVIASQEWTNYPITVAVDDRHEGFTLEIKTERVVDPLRIGSYLITAMHSLLSALEEVPSTLALTLPILPELERRRIVEEFNASYGAYPQDKLIHELFEDQVARTPNSLAVVHDGLSLTYFELNRRANQLARHLQGIGVCADQIVALYLERSIEMVIGLLGVLKAGGAYMPMDASNPADRLQHLLSDARPKVVLMHERLKSTFPETTAHSIALDREWETIGKQSGDNLDRQSLQLDPRNLAYVIYTSGSTGKPKGVMIEHRNIVNYAIHALRQFEVTSGSGSLICTSFGFDLMLTGLYPTLLGGQVIRLCPERQDFAAISAEILKCSQLSPLKLTPSHLSLLEHALLSGKLTDRVRVLVCGGEPLQADTVQLWREHAPRTRIFNHYGPTETTVGCVVNEIEESASGAIPIGRPISNTQIYILNRDLQPTPVGVLGEIYVGGAGIARGYLNRPGLTAERFLADPFTPDPRARMYKTGDLGHWRADGKIDFAGRNDHQVKVRGFRIELGEIESKLREHERVDTAVVLVREDFPGERRIVAYVIPTNSTIGEGVPSAEELRTHLKAVLPEYMVPSAFVTLQTLPLTPNGKLDRRALPRPELDAYSRRSYEAPQGVVEAAVAEIWQTLLRVEQIGRQDNFFELGGHSLLATRAIAHIRDRLQVELPLRSLFDEPTVAQLSILIAADRDALSRQGTSLTDGLSDEMCRNIDELNDEEILAEIVQLKKELRGAADGEPAPL